MSRTRSDFDTMPAVFLIFFVAMIAACVLGAWLSRQNPTSTPPRALDGHHEHR